MISIPASPTTLSASRWRSSSARAFTPPAAARRRRGGTGHEDDHRRHCDASGLHTILRSWGSPPWYRAGPGSRIRPVRTTERFVPDRFGDRAGELGGPPRGTSSTTSPAAPPRRRSRRHRAGSRRGAAMAAPPPYGHLAVEILVDPVDRVVTVHVWPFPRWSRLGPVPVALPRPRNPTTASGAAFFRDGCDSSPFRSGLSRISAISLYENPSISARITAIRNCSGIDSSASFTSASGSNRAPRSPGCAAIGRLEPAQPAEDVEVLDVVEVDLVGPALLGAVLVDERVREDAVEPRLQVRALLEPTEAAVRAQVRLLHQVLGVGRVAGHPERGRVQRRHVRRRQFCEGRLVRHDPGGTYRDLGMHPSPPGGPPRCRRGRRPPRSPRHPGSPRAGPVPDQPAVDDQPLHPFGSGTLSLCRP